MGYRGDDLDLRTPRGWASPGEPDSDGMASGPIERYTAPRRPIWVDETVLACCNQAFEVAQTHRAPEVRLEHLLHAMTRVEGAAEVLEARGVRVFNLRRETAATIGGEMPSGQKDVPANPRRSDELEDVLRRAAAQAYRHGTSAGGDPASIDDIIDVLSDVRLDLPGLALFARHASRGPREFAAMRRMVPFAYDSSATGSGPGSRERARFPAPHGQDSFTPASRRDSFVEHYDVSRHPEPSFPIQILDRLETLEQALRDLKTSAGGQSGLVQNAVAQIESTVHARADDVSGGFGHVLQALKALDGRLGAGVNAAALVPINEKLAMIEEALLAPAPSSAQDTRVHFDGLRQALDEHRGRAVAAYASIQAEVAALKGVLARVDGLPSAIERRHGELSTALGKEFARVAATDEKVQALVAESGAKHDQRVATMENAVLGALRGLEQRHKNVSQMIEQWSRANGECLDHIDGRLERVEAGHARALDMMETVYRLTVERYQWRARFWRWLFGTNDWMAASWPAETARVDAEMRGKVGAS